MNTQAQFDQTTFMMGFYSNKLKRLAKIQTMLEKSIAKRLNPLLDKSSFKVNDETVLGWQTKIREIYNNTTDRGNKLLIERSRLKSLLRMNAGLPVASDGNRYF
jgi:hypothetical protein